MFSTSCSIFVVFFCLNLVSSQENPVIRREDDNRIYISMKSIDVDPGRNIDNACNDYSIVHTCLNDRLEVTCPVDQHYFREKYGWGYDFEGRMSMYKQTKNGLGTLRVGSNELVADEALRDVTNDPCYFCWYNVRLSTTLHQEQRSKAAKVQFYDCQWLNKIETIYYAQSASTNVSFTCWDAHLEESATIEWYLQGPSDNKFNLLSSSDTSNISNVYEINNILKGDIGLYKCYVWFRDSRIRFSRQFDLRLAMPPMKPIKFDITDRSDTQVVLTFEENQNNSKYASNKSENRPWFQIRYYAFEKSDINQSIKVTTNDTRANLTGLIPFTMYVAELRQVNIFGESEPIYTAFLTKNPTAVGRPFDIRVTAVFNHSVTLKCYNYGNVSQEYQWRFTVSDSLNEVYTTKARYKAVSTYDAESKLASLYQCKTDTYVIDNAESNDAGLYQCKTFFNGLLDYVFTIRLSVVMPPLDPKEFRCQSSKLRCLTLTWTSAAQENQDFLDRTIGGYKLKYKKSIARKAGAKQFCRRIIPKWWWKIWRANRIIPFACRRLTKLEKAILFRRCAKYPN